MIDCFKSEKWTGPNKETGLLVVVVRFAAQLGVGGRLPATFIYADMSHIYSPRNDCAYATI